jgi:integrase
LTKITPGNLVPVQIKHLGPGRYCDGGGLFLIIDKPKNGADTVGHARWVLHYRVAGRRVEMGLGGLSSANNLKKAREAAEKARVQLADGINPVDARAAIAAIPTFGEMADAVIKTKEASFRRARSGAIWRRALDRYAQPIRSMRVDHVDIAAVLKVLRPIWDEKPETAHKVRGCLEAVLSAAKARGYRRGENPAAWRDNLDHLLAKRRKLIVGHQKAMFHGDVPAFLTKLRERDAITAKGLEFLILTAARTKEVIHATWGEIDLVAKVWTVPGERMKSGRQHRVPLSARAVAILENIRKGNGNRPPDAFLFPGPRKPGSIEDRSLSTNAFRALLIRMGVTDAVAHGFRGSFKTWANEASMFPRELAEAALSHVVGDETERAYVHGDALAKRRKLMEAWAGHCNRPTPVAGNVVAMKVRQGAA